MSRVPNSTVFARVKVLPLSEQILKQQFLLFGRVAFSQAGSPLRRDTFIGDSLNPWIGHYVRRVLRPRLDWTSQLLQQAASRFGSATFQALLRDRSDGAYLRWKVEVERVFSFSSNP